MGKVRREVYKPDLANAAIYDELYAEYVTLHDYFGRGAGGCMHRLRALRDRILGNSAGPGGRPPGTPRDAPLWRSP
jgi:L-ribulokinase